MFSEPKLIIFDLDGTLIDSVPDLADAVDTTLQELALPPAGEQRVRSWVGNGAAKLIERALAYASAADLQEQALKQFFKHYEANCSVKTTLYPGVLDTLKELQGLSVKMAIATNKPRRFIQPILAHLNIASYFKALVAGDDLPEKKPHPAQLHRCMDCLAFSASQTWMVGDSHSDVRAAQKAGVPVIAVNYGYNHGRSIEEEGADKVIANFLELLDIFNTSRLQSMPSR